MSSSRLEVSSRSRGVARVAGRRCSDARRVRRHGAADREVPLVLLHGDGRHDQDLVGVGPRRSVASWRRGSPPAVLSRRDRTSPSGACEGRRERSCLGSVMAPSPPSPSPRPSSVFQEAGCSRCRGPVVSKAVNVDRVEGVMPRSAGSSAALLPSRRGMPHFWVQLLCALVQVARRVDRPAVSELETVITSRYLGSSASS